ncbi:hypothetical protein L917_04016 [Phytophthora nicotianae]|uniref:Histone-lysine N-methyltransferase n=1 Tax=Phytophthora nicotianae TaxID=4792 RepID=W2LNB9_PHYNI|nr:hypothetical protein L916_04116 [Phytophthora nicotianae]ETL99003.1 hypothetical protein L917_04016 [Phytophthora nicotianae]
MPPKQAGRRGPAKKRKLEATSPNGKPKRAKPGPGRLLKKNSTVVSTNEPEPEAGPQDLLDPETTIFLQLLEDDVHRLPPPPPPLPKRRGSAKSPLEKRIVEFQLPFKEAEIKSLEERQWVRRPPPFGKISRCVYVSTKMPIADFPVHKCTCYEEIHKSMTKRTTMMASAKAQKVLADKEQDIEKHDEMERIVYCGEGCYNRMLLISCSDETCSAPDPSLCSNRAIKRRELKSMRVEYIPGPGFGLIANEDINAGEFVIEYVGEVIDDKECERRMITYRDNGEVNFYMMELEKNIVIDAKYRSNDSRFINHSCDPNCVTQKWNVDGMQRIGIFARRNIAPNEEITIDYNFSHFGEAADCRCGSTSCTGKIGLKRSKMPSFDPRVVGTAKAKKQVPVDEEPPELKRPVHLTSLALLKSSQMHDSWLEYYGFKNRRLFLSHRSRRPKKEEGNVHNGELRCLPSSSPSSVSSTTTEEDVSLTPPQATHSKPVEKISRNSNWYEKVIAGKHLPEMRALHSYICGGISDWTIHLTTDFTIEASSPVLAKKGPGRPPKKRGRPKANQTTSGTKLIHKRLGLSQAQARCIDELAAFAEGKSKWNKRVPSSSSIDPDRIHRLIDRVKGKQIFVNTDQNDLNEDACFRCGLAGELICCDGCPAAFHLNCTNLAMVPPDGIPWFCSECTNPKHLQKTTETAQTAAIAARSSGRTTPTDYSGRHLRTHAAHQIPSLKKIFHVPAPHTKRRYKKRHKATDRSYRELEHMPLPVWNESDASETEQ